MAACMRYKRSEKWNSNDYFNEINGIAKPLYRYTTLGATLGGPVRLPKQIARDKLFFFYSYENWDTLTPNPRSSGHHAHGGRTEWRFFAEPRSERQSHRHSRSDHAAAVP